MTYTTVENVGNYLRLTIDTTSTPSQATVEMFIDWAESEIDHITKTQYDSELIKDEIVDINSDTAYSSAVSFDASGALHLPAKWDMIRLSEGPVISLKEVWFNTVGATETPVWEAKTIGEGGDVILKNGAILLTGKSSPRFGTSQIKVSYFIGRKVVPKFVEKLATRMVALEIMTGAQASQLTSGSGRIKIGDIELDDPGTFSQSFIKMTREEIKELLNSLGTESFMAI